MPRKKCRHWADGEVFSLDIPFNRTMLHFLEDRYEKLECLRAPGCKTRRAWHAPDGADQGECHHKVGLTRDCRPASGNKPEAPRCSGRLGSCPMCEGCSRRCSASRLQHDAKNET